MSVKSQPKVTYPLVDSDILKVKVSGTLRLESNPLVRVAKTKRSSVVLAIVDGEGNEREVTLRVGDELYLPINMEVGGL